MNELQVTRGVSHGPPNMTAAPNEAERTRKMEQIPQWLTAAVDAAGMTAYAEGLEPKHLKRAPESSGPAVDETPILPLH